jgi:hypothetical protein
LPHRRKDGEDSQEWLSYDAAGKRVNDGGIRRKNKHIAQRMGDLRKSQRNFARMPLSKEPGDLSRSH